MRVWAGYACSVCYKFVYACVQERKSEQKRDGGTEDDKWETEQDGTADGDGM